MVLMSEWVWIICMVHLLVCYFVVRLFTCMLLDLFVCSPAYLFINLFGYCVALSCIVCCYVVAVVCVVVVSVVVIIRLLYFYFFFPFIFMFVALDPLLLSLLNFCFFGLSVLVYSSVFFFFFCIHLPQSFFSQSNNSIS